MWNYRDIIVTTLVLIIIVLCLSLCTSVITGCDSQQGSQGVQGETGPRGSRGIEGEHGMPGIQGVQGVQGPKGDSDTIRTIIETTLHDSMFIVQSDTIYDLLTLHAPDDYIDLTLNNPVNLSWDRVLLDTTCSEEDYVEYIPSASIIIPNWTWPAQSDTSISFTVDDFVDGSLIVFRVLAIDQAGNVSRNVQWNRIYVVKK